MNRERMLTPLSATIFEGKKSADEYESLKKLYSMLMKFRTRVCEIVKILWYAENQNNIPKK